MGYRILLICAALLFFSGVNAQEYAFVEGIVSDSAGRPLEATFIADTLSQQTVTSAANGSYRLKIHAGKPTAIHFSYPGCRKLIPIPAISGKAVYKLNLPMSSVITLAGAEVTRDKRDIGIIILDPKDFIMFPNPTRDISNILKTLGPVSSNNELSTQYNVRGGNYDENLVYVNDIEIYRPFLVRTGQQEGLSFANPDMVSNINFSAGGFEAKYGDKMSSVLDITYRKPDRKSVV